MITVLFTDRHLNVVGDPVTCWTTVNCTARFNEVGSGQITVPAYPWIREQIDHGRRAVVVRDGDVFLAGPVESYLVEQSDDGENSGVGKLTVDFADDLSNCANRITFPNPAQTPEGQTVDQWTFAGNGEQALRQLVTLNAGPDARAERQVPQLVLGSTAGVGGTVSVSTRLEPLTDVLRRVALDAGGLGFRTRQDGTQILFEVFQPRDLTGSVRFGFGLGNLRYLGYSRAAPTATTAVVGGQGEGSDRYLIARSNTSAESAWGRVETHVARPGSDPVADLQAEGDRELAEKGETARLQTSAWDTPDQRFGEHYRLGDRVSVQVGPGEQVSDLVRLVSLQAWDTAGELVSAMVGTQEASSDPAWVRQMRGIDRRVGYLERRALPSTSGM
ncbi:siphovirus ReqiPepy6 Gp37-like family protein [Micromonospora sp. NPDC000207]|uniref:siphovirus ReqiPepy6 Gp37-like family protein n=1 Tax=Micromonospora sp. NPDC000207 TaxID=3154246 RepID=UPI00332C6276